MTKLNGGYITRAQRAVKTPEHKSAHSGLLQRPMQGASLEALNWIQKTKWSVNRDVLGVIEEIVARGWAVDSIPAADNAPMPPKMDPANFARLTSMADETKKKDFKSRSKEEREPFEAAKIERSKYLRSRGNVYTSNKMMECERYRLNRMFKFAQDMAQFPAIWYPHTADFRGRVYPVPQDLHTQGNSLVKGMLTFAERQRIGQDGGAWLRVAFANSFGQDKISLSARADWAEQQMRFVVQTAEDPMGNLDFWAHDKVDSPWEALALCFELAALAKHSGPEATFESHIPVRLDATCSGIQHLSAMMKDTLSARAVNVDPTGIRADIYSDVAKVAMERIAMDAATHKESEVRVLATKWLGKVERKTVKRAVMTTPYGVTAPGIKNQLIDDGFCDHFEQGTERYKAAEYLKDVTINALDANIGAPRAAMEYFQAVAQHLAEADKGLTWTTPAGFTVNQAYFKENGSRCDSLLGSLMVRSPDVAAGLDRRKQKSSAAPNVVHSYDAAHLCLVAVQMKHSGVRDLAFVHDSFGCHAGNVGTLNHHIREEFVGMYAGPALEQWRQSVVDHSGCPDVPEVPTLGTLDVSAVRKSEFFFS